MSIEDELIRRKWLVYYKTTSHLFDLNLTVFLVDCPLLLHLHMQYFSFFCLSFTPPSYAIFLFFASPLLSPLCSLLHTPLSLQRVSSYVSASLTGRKRSIIHSLVKCHWKSNNACLRNWYWQSVLYQCKRAHNIMRHTVVVNEDRWTIAVT